MNPLLLIALLAVSPVQGESAADTPATDENEIATLLHPYYVHQAADYSFSLDSNKDKVLKLVPHLL